MINEEYLIEKTKQQLIDKSKKQDLVNSYKTTRYIRRNKIKIKNNISVFNKIDMNSVFKADMLSMKIPAIGETNNYAVEILLDNICSTIKKNVQQNKNKLEFKCIYQAIYSILNRDDILISCTCPDFKYRQQYYAHVGGYNQGKPETRKSEITNPKDTKGGGCKHVLAVLENSDWIMKTATSILNYINYMEKNQKNKFVTLIFPKIYSVSYSEYSGDHNKYGTGDKDLPNQVDNKKDVITKTNNTTKENQPQKPADKQAVQNNKNQVGK